MKTGKFVKVCSGVILGLSLLSTTAFAGVHHTTTTSKYNYPTCNVANCKNKYSHTHNGAYYSAHHTNDGHRYHR